MNNAFKNSDEGLHLKWIKILLEKYYDRMYGYKLKLRNKHVIFKGNENFIKKQNLIPLLLDLKKYLDLQDEEQSLRIIHALVPEWEP